MIPLPPEEVTNRLIAVTQSIREDMARVGWWIPGYCSRIHKLPTAREINCGWCDDWANAAEAAVGGQVFWLEDLDPDRLTEFPDMSHCVLYLNGLWYDSQTVYGVSHPQELPIVRCVPHPEEE